LLCCIPKPAYRLVRLTRSHVPGEELQFAESPIFWCYWTLGTVRSNANHCSSIRTALDNVCEHCRDATVVIYSSSFGIVLHSTDTTSTHLSWHVHSRTEQNWLSICWTEYRNDVTCTLNQIPIPTVITFRQNRCTTVFIL